MKPLNILKHYIKDRIYIILLILIILTIYVNVYYVYTISSEALIYATYLISLVLILFFIIDFYHYYKKHRYLTIIKNNILYLDDLPKKKTLLEQDYQTLINQLKKIDHENASIHKAQFKEMEDYFTLWAHQMKLPIAAMKILIETETIPDKNF